MSPFSDVRAVRRVITGHTADGRSTVAFDERASAHRANRRYAGVEATDLWRSSARADRGDDRDGVELYDRLPVGGSQFYIVTIAPGITVPMHATDTIDHHCVVSGEIICVLEDREVRVAAGDVLVLRGGLHGWENRGTQPWVSVVTMVSALSSPSAGGADPTG